MTARSEPLLWLQLIGLGAIPLELLLVLLLLAGSDPGPFPGLERVLTWAFGAVGPSVLLWRMAPDPFSLLLICTPVRLRTPDQLGFSQQPMGLPLKLLLASGTAFLLPLLWWLDTTSVLATSFALLPTPNRLAALVAVAPLLSLMVWQWQQVAQATLLLGRNQQPTLPPPGAGGPPAAPRQPLCLGLPWLRLPALTQAATPELLQQPEGPNRAQWEKPEETQDEMPVEPRGEEPGEAALVAEVIAISAPDEPEPEEASPVGSSPEEPEAQEPAAAESEAEEPAAPTEDQQQNVGVAPGDPEITDVEFTPLESAQLDDARLESAAVAIEPEEAAEEAEGTDLDPQIG